MKRKLIALGMCLMLILPVGCVTFDAAKTKWNASSSIEKWNSSVSYYKTFASGLKVAANLAEIFYPDSKDVIESLVKPLVNKSLNAVDALDVVVDRANAGVITPAELEVAAAEVKKAVDEASAAVAPYTGTNKVSPLPINP